MGQGLLEYVKFMTFDSYLVRVNRAGMEKYDVKINCKVNLRGSIFSGKVWN